MNGVRTEHRLLTDDPAMLGIWADAFPRYAARGKTAYKRVVVFRRYAFVVMTALAWGSILLLYVGAVFGLFGSYPSTLLSAVVFGLWYWYARTGYKRRVLVVVKDKG